MTTPISRSGHPVAVVVHDAALDGRDLEQEIGASARLVVDNERLRAEALAQLADLRASQARIVESADAERRRLERDLHDGAQQQLLGLAYDLRVARAGAETDGDRELAELLGSAVAGAQAAFDQLRELAHGIFPAVLAEGGLQAALATLADVASLPVVLGPVTNARYSAVVETTAYLTVVEAVEDAAARAAGYVRVEARDDGDLLVIRRRRPARRVAGASRRTRRSSTPRSSPACSDDDGAHDPLAELASREREVLGLVAEGLSNRAIAGRLFVTERTVEAHVKQIFQKLGLEARPESHRRVLAVLAYLRAGADPASGSPARASP